MFAKPYKVLFNLSLNDYAILLQQHVSLRTLTSEKRVEEGIRIRHVLISRGTAVIRPRSRGGSVLDQSFGCVLRRLHLAVMRTDGHFLCPVII